MFDGDELLVAPRTQAVRTRAPSGSARTSLVGFTVAGVCTSYSIWQPEPTGGAVKVWEYRILDWSEVPPPVASGRGMLKSFRLSLNAPQDAERAVAYFNQLGAEGWEVLSISHPEGGHWEGFTGLAKREK
jgi:hypothetical protein